jgi:hypothetical protein
MAESFLRNWYLLKWSRNNPSFVSNPKIGCCLHTSRLLNLLLTQINLAHTLLLSFFYNEGYALSYNATSFHLAYAGFASLTLRLWGWRRNIPPKHHAIQHSTLLRSHHRDNLRLIYGNTMLPSTPRSTELFSSVQVVIWSITLHSFSPLQ